MAKIVIVGGGVAGLSAGIYSRMAGHDVVICERHFLAGKSKLHIDSLLSICPWAKAKRESFFDTLITFI